MGEYEQAIEHDRRQIMALFAFPNIQFLPGIPESPEQHHLRWLYQNGVIPGPYGYRLNP